MVVLTHGRSIRARVCSSIPRNIRFPPREQLQEWDMEEIRLCRLLKCTHAEES